MIPLKNIGAFRLSLVGYRSIANRAFGKSIFNGEIVPFPFQRGWLRWKWRKNVCK